MTPVLGIIASSNQQGRGGAVGSYDALATIVVPSGGLATVSFAGIPTGYRHLQLRIQARTDMNSGGAWSPIGMRYNGDTAANYYIHDFYGIGSGSVTPEAYAAQVQGIAGFGAPSTNTASSFGASIVDILDYNIATKTKTVRVASGVENNGSGLVIYGGHLWTTTAAITSISFHLLGSTNGSNFLANSQFALYGVK